MQYFIEMLAIKCNKICHINQYVPPTPETTVRCEHALATYRKLISSSISSNLMI